MILYIGLHFLVSINTAAPTHVSTADSKQKLKNKAIRYEIISSDRTLKNLQLAEAILTENIATELKGINQQIDSLFNPIFLKDSLVMVTLKNSPASTVRLTTGPVSEISEMLPSKLFLMLDSRMNFETVITFTGTAITALPVLSDETKSFIFLFSNTVPSQVCLIVP